METTDPGERIQDQSIDLTGLERFINPDEIQFIQEIASGRFPGTGGNDT